MTASMWPSPPNSTRVIGLHNQPVTAVHRSGGTSRRASAKINIAEPQVAATTGTLINICPVSASGPVVITTSRSSCVQTGPYGDCGCSGNQPSCRSDSPYG